ncbi:hypothetical protein SDC9_140653 [bioreactor metagenome]|uniref:Uncharacterized protein n=1 Tax=bioreactor metagenome TaxID=1076179 RepID=A0A645DW32_9ZZZZ
MGDIGLDDFQHFGVLLAVDVQLCNLFNRPVGFLDAGKPDGFHAVDIDYAARCEKRKFAGQDFAFALLRIKKLRTVAYKYRAHADCLFEAYVRVVVPVGKLHFQIIYGIIKCRHVVDNADVVAVENYFAAEKEIICEISGQDK